MLSLGWLYTDDTKDDNDNNNDDDNDNDDNNNDNDNNNDDNDTRQTNHDCIGSLACMPNEPKTPNHYIQVKSCLKFLFNKSLTLF